MASPSDGRDGRPRADRIPGETPHPEGWAKHPDRKMVMTPLIAALGGVLAFATTLLIAAALPTATYDPPPSRNWLPLSDAAIQGRGTFLANGCFYCHSGFSRPQDHFVGQYFLYPRISAPGDYFGQSHVPNILGSERTGPDLSQQSGAHPDDWNFAHFFNPRFTIPFSVMPQFSFLSNEDVKNLTTFVQTRSGKRGVLMYATQLWAKEFILNARGLPQPTPGFTPRPLTRRDLKRGAPRPAVMPGRLSRMIALLAQTDRGYWLTENPIPLSEQALLRGRSVFRQRCIGCHGELGNGRGPASDFLVPPPFNFTKRINNSRGLWTSDGVFYYRILVGHVGTAMEPFGSRLSVADIWRTVHFLRTIPRGGLTEPVPTLDMYEPWRPPQTTLDYIERHPIQDQAVYERPEIEPTNDVFLDAAKFALPGMSVNQVLPIEVDGVPVSLRSARNQIRQRALALARDAYFDAKARGEKDLPPLDQVLDFRQIDPAGFQPACC